MVYGCGSKTVKCLVGFFNLLAFIAGAALLITCAVSYTNSGIQQKILSAFDKIDAINTTKLSSINAILIGGMVVGGIIMLLGFLGCCGACCESKCLLIIFVISMTIMLLVQVILAGVLIGMKGKIKKEIGNGIDKLENQASNKTDKNHDMACSLFKDLDTNLHCCGANGTLEAFKCGDVLKTCSEETLKLPQEERMCRTKVGNFLYDNFKTFGIVGLVFMVLEIAAIVFVSMLVCAMHKGQSLYERV